MLSEYESLVGYLNIVGGRSISAQPPGILVEVAPKKAARGREGDTFFVLALPSGDVVAPAAFYERMAHLAAERYFSSSGSVTNGLRTVFNSLNQDLFEHNEANPKHYEASLIAAVLRGADLYLGRVGAGIALYRSADALVPFPAEFSNDDALFGPPLGVRPVPDAKMAHYEVGEAARLLLADATLADADFPALADTLTAPDIGTLLVDLKGLGVAQLTLVAVEFVAPETPVALPVREGESSAALVNARPAAVNGAAGGAVVVAPSTGAAIAAAKEGDLSPMVEKLTAVAEQTSLGLRRGASVAASGLSRSARGLSTVIEKTRKPDAAPAPRRSPLLNLIAVLIPVLVVVVVMALWLSGTGESEFELCVSEATQAAESARAVPSSQVVDTNNAWIAVMAVVERCNAIRSGDPALTNLTREGQSVIDALLQVTRRDPVRIESFPSAQITRMVVQGSQMYVLDDANEQVYGLTLAEDGRSMVRNSRQPLASMSPGAPVDQFILSDDIVDIAWADNAAGLNESTALIALDSNGVLVECSPRFLDNCSAQQLGAAENLRNPVAMQVWDQRLYILDAGSSQIWRYTANGGSFAGSPAEYFAGEGRLPLENAVDFAIADGRVYIVMNNGTLYRLYDGEPEGFTFSGFPEPTALSSVNALFLDTNPIYQALYFVNPANRTIYETSWSGTFWNSYRVYDEDLFSNVEDVVVDINLGVIYVASGNSVLAFDSAR